MRFKKGFTLAEILIVLMVLGALAVMTIPTLIKGVTESQIKTAYKKALNSIVNLTTMENLSGNMPIGVSAGNADRLFDLLNQSMSIKSYVSSDKAKLNANVVSVDKKEYTGTAPTAANRHSYWLVGDDNISYLITQGADCKSKSDIISGQDSADANGTAMSTSYGGTGALTSPESASTAKNSCFVIYVDINGPSQGPNAFVDYSNKIKGDVDTPQILSDQFPIYIAKDGATAGNQNKTITGRIAADIKK